jgi:hypothetical protein
VEFLESILSGGALGVLGGLFTEGLKVFKAKQRHQQTLEIKKLDIQAEEKRNDYALDNFKLEIQQREKELAAQSEIATTEAGAKALAASYNHDTAQINHDGHAALIWTEVIRKLTRPFLTGLLVLCTMAIYFSTDDIGIKTQIAVGVLSACTAAIMWWFTNSQLGRVK